MVFRFETKIGNRALTDSRIAAGFFTI